MEKVIEKISTIEFVKKFTHCMTHEDSDGLLKLWNKDGEWIIMATGERFKGIEKIKELAKRSMDARVHKTEEGLLPFNVFTNAEGTRLIWEYVHIGEVTDKWPASKSKPVVGTKFELPIILSCEISEGKLSVIREYFDLQTLTEAGTPHHLYS